ncbi:metalloregulator ArsR/SmtB family transcription factor [uncultured Jannaschia sp.]|uniref:ArsR/SmtB family transcription factor n=1 Tax=uncultured Jannaschia sp. TaxID=293347 RepID=UPI002630FB4E|nr:metalloregulator ArsR/SmtB family transcription factor [uncultured Jannaschia sp.]
MNDDTAHGAILTALADPTRRAVLDRLRDGPLPVARIAEPMPVTRPAVSQHLKVLLDAGLVSMRRQGTRNIYGLTPGGAEPLVVWLGDLTERRPDLPGLVVRLSPDDARRLFIDDVALWWPVAQLSFSAMGAGALPRSIGWRGDRLHEVMYDGSGADWARITTRTASRVALDWRLGGRTELIAGFASDPDGCRVTLDWGGAGKVSGDMQALVAERYGTAARASLSNF